MSIFVEIAVKSVGLLALVWIVAFLLRSHSAAMRHRVWALGFVGLGLLPILAIRLPEIRIERPGPSVSHKSLTPQPTGQSIEPKSQGTPAQIASPEPRTLSRPAPAPTAESRTPSAVPTILFGIWAAGAALLLCRMGARVVAALGLSRGGEIMSVDPRFGLPPHTQIVRTGKVDVPMTLGFWRSTILLPATSNSLSDERFRAVLMHEGAHIQRGDWLWLIFGQALSAIYWPNPLVHFAASRMRAEAELAADDAVLVAGFDAPGYAETLVDIASNLRAKSLAAAIPFAEPGSLKARIESILKGSRSRGPVGRRGAIVALAVCAAVVIPFAAARLVAGPEVIRDGVIVLGDDSQAEIIAITEMRDGRAISWDRHGALTRRTFSVGEDQVLALRNMKAVPAGYKVRYVLVRLNSQKVDFPPFASSWGDFVACLPYTGPSDENSLGFQDALGGTYRILQIAAPTGASKASLETKVPAANWSLFAYANYTGGETQQVLNPSVGIHIAPMTPGHGEGTEATLTLPKAFADREARVRFLPSWSDVSYVEGLSGPITASTLVKAEAVTRVEVLSRTMRRAIVADLPLEPDLKAIYTPRHFLPDDVIAAVRGTAELTDGTKLGIELISRGDGDPELVWDANGNTVAVKRPPGWSNNLWMPEPKNDSKRMVQLWLQHQPRSAAHSQVLYDSEGWPLFHNVQNVVSPQHDLWGFYSILDYSVRSSDIVAQVVDAPYRTLRRFEREDKNGVSWTVGNRLGWHGVLHLDCHNLLGNHTLGWDIEFVPLDAKGKPVTGLNDTQGCRYSPDWLEFDLSSFDMARVNAVEVRGRPYHWIRFPNVALEPMTLK